MCICINVYIYIYIITSWYVVLHYITLYHIAVSSRPPAGAGGWARSRPAASGTCFNIVQVWSKRRPVRMDTVLMCIYIYIYYLFNAYIHTHT